MRNIQRRLKELRKRFPPLKNTGPDRLQAAALARLSRQDLFLLRELNEKLKSSRFSELTDPEARALEAYYSAFDLETRQARLNSKSTVLKS